MCLRILNILYLNKINKLQNKCVATRQIGCSWKDALKLYALARNRMYAYSAAALEPKFWTISKATTILVVFTDS